ncbi:MAG: hypothetical protein ACREUW_04685 [Burkholderiales bacterium]
MTAVPLTRALALACALLAGCASTPEASQEANEMAQRFESRKDAAVIFVYRDDRFAPLNQFTGLIDERVFGQILPTTFFKLVEFPGTRRISIQGGTNASVTLQAEANVVYFIHLQANGSVVQLRQVPAEQGERDILSCCDLMENWKRGQRRLNF